jgi:hypothetical protein
MDLVFQSLVYVRFLNWVEHRSIQVLDAAVHDWTSKNAGDCLALARLL